MLNVETRVSPDARVQVGGAFVYTPSSEALYCVLDLNLN